MTVSAEVSMRLGMILGMILGGGLAVLATGCLDEPTAAGAPVEVPDGAVGSACESDDACSGDQRCEWNVCVGGDGDTSGTIPAGDADDATRAAVGRVCARLHGDCADVCDNLFVECYGDVSQCTQQWTADYLEDFTFPIVDEDLAVQCAAQIDDQACTDLEPDTLECEFAIVESCPGDDDGYGAPYSPFRAADLPASGSVELMLCEDVTEYFRVTLAQGQSVRVTALDPEADAPWIDLSRLVGGGGTTKLEEVEGYLSSDGDELSAPAPLPGEYLLSVRSSQGTRRFAFTLAVE
jgi:hypothetical protein